MFVTRRHAKTTTGSALEAIQSCVRLTIDKREESFNTSSFIGGIHAPPSHAPMSCSEKPSFFLARKRSSST